MKCITVSCIFHQCNTMKSCLSAFVFILAVFNVCAQNSDKIYRICVSERQATSYDCNILKRAGSKFNCVTVTDNVDCALKFERNEADFGIFTAEEAILTSIFDPQNQRTVVAEIRNPERETEPFRFETVAVVKDDFSGPLSALEGKSLCHPGFSKSQLWTDRVLKHFERVVLNRTLKCDRASRTSAEDELFALSTFFKKACRPGMWVVSDFLDKKFKTQYSNLCALCDSVTGCSQNPQADGNQFSTLDCLTKKGGDVAYVAYFYAQRYFGLINTYQPHVDPSRYRFLCPNGTIEVVSSNSDSCKWIQQPWDSILAKDDATAIGLREELEKYLPANVESRGSNDWIDTIKNIIIQRTNKLVLKPRISVKSFIEKGRNIPEPGTTLPCRNPVKWCTTSKAENKKCEWLRQAGITLGLVPELNCVQSTSTLNCFKTLKEKAADIVGTDTNLGPIAGHFYNLTTSMYQETEQSGFFKVVAVVNYNVTAANMKEMKNKRACFPEYGGLAWISFVDAIRDSSQSESNICSYDDSMGTFFESVCAPGAKSHLLGSGNSNSHIDLCTLCSEAYRNSSTNISIAPFSSDESCDANIRNKFYGDIGALRCLGSGVADMAFLNSYNLSLNLRDDKLPEDFAQKYMIMCRNGSKVSLTSIVDDECALTVVTGGEVVARGSRSRIEARELYLMLLELDEWFGYTSSHFENIFHLFETFDNGKDLLFRNEALGFIPLFEKDEEASIKIYATLKSNAEKCIQPKPPTTPSGAQDIQIEQISMFLMFTITVIQVYL